MVLASPAGFPGSLAGKNLPAMQETLDQFLGWEDLLENEGIGYPHQYSWASLVAQMVKNLPAARETWVPSWDWEAPLEKGETVHSGILAWRVPWTVCIVHGVAKSQNRLTE